MPTYGSNAIALRLMMAALGDAETLIVSTRMAIARATWLISRTPPLVALGWAPHHDLTGALRAFSELELAGRAASRVDAHVSQAGVLLRGGGQRRGHPVPGAEAAEIWSDGVDDARAALRAVARAAVVADAARSSVGVLFSAIEPMSPPASGGGRGHSTTAKPAGHVRAAEHDADEVVSRTATAGRRLAVALGWESELRRIVDEERAGVGVARPLGAGVSHDREVVPRRADHEPITAREA